MILFLDDSPQRTEVFLQLAAMAGQKCDAVSTYDEACDAIRAQVYDCVYLDHDLNDFGKRSVLAGAYGGVELTGTDVCMFITGLKPERRPKAAVIHSMNPAGARRMVDILTELEIPTAYQPFEVGASLPVAVPEATVNG
jgi:CheY-like chemotaxis protein